MVAGIRPTPATRLAEMPFATDLGWQDAMARHLAAAAAGAIVCEADPRHEANVQGDDAARFIRIAR